MKLINFSEKLLKYMVAEFKKSGRLVFDLDIFKNLYPNESDEFISQALYLLERENFVSILPADDVAYTTTLNPTGIAHCEEKTLLKKGYRAIKEIKSLLS